ncbi:MAG: LapA family protein [Opitutaceae bacterium]|jgi:lipopolysaccharide assembly protein A|nr:LapA family protein [Opitutaceae bacterium]
MRKVKLYGILAAVLLAAVVIMQNTTVVETKVLFMTIAMPRAALLALTFGLGIVIGVTIPFIWSRKKEKSAPLE